MILEIPSVVEKFSMPHVQINVWYTCIELALGCNEQMYEHNIDNAGRLSPVWYRTARRQPRGICRAVLCHVVASSCCRCLFAVVDLWTTAHDGQVFHEHQ